MKSNIKRFLPDVVMVLLFLVVSTVYFWTPMAEGLVLGGHDSASSH